MSGKKLVNQLKKDANYYNSAVDDFVKGGSQVRHYFDTALISIFGRKLGLLVSNYLIKIGIQNG